MIPQIRMEQQFARIGLRTTLSQWRIASPPADLNLHQELPRMQIRQIPGKLEIDQSEAFAQEGLMSIFDLIRKEAERARQAALEGIAETAEWGDRFAHIEQGGNPIADWAARNVGRREDWTFGLMPEPLSVHIRYEPGRAEIGVQPGRVDLHPVLHRPEVTFRPGAVKVYMRQYASVTIIPPPLPGLLVDERR